MTIPDHLPQSARAFAASRQALFAALDAGEAGAAVVAGPSAPADPHVGERPAHSRAGPWRAGGCGSSTSWTRR